MWRFALFPASGEDLYKGEAGFHNIPFIFNNSAVQDSLRIASE